MPRQEVIRKARQDKRAGKSASTQAGEFVRDEIEKGKHGAHPGAPRDLMSCSDLVS